MPIEGKFIVIEGLDGSGKSTQLKKVVRELQSLNFRIYVTSEPSSQKIGKMCRVYLMDNTSNPHVDALIFAADRIEHYENEIKPKLDEGYLVITDRYILSSVAYQGSQGVDTQWIKEINKWVPQPDLALFLDIPVSRAVKRLDSHPKEKEKFENKQALEKVLKIYQNESSHLIQLDATRPPDYVTKEIVDRIKHLF